MNKTLLWIPLTLAVAAPAGYLLAPKPPVMSPAQRGKVLTTVGSCADCHTPWKMTAEGPQPDRTRWLSGHPEGLTFPPPPAPSGPWIMAAAATNTAWSGPWGVSYTANLTPDDETGLGRWTEDTFLQAIRNQRHMGRGRPLLPPMPAPMIAQLSDDDLRAIFAYLRTLTPIHNRVPEPLPPTGPARNP